MKITLDIPDGIIAGFFNGVEVTAHGMHYNWDGVEWIVTEALAHGNKVVINADW